MGGGVDVRGGDVGVRPDQIAQVGNVAPGDLAQVALAQFLGIATDAPLGAAKRHVDDGALPGHPCRQGAHFIQGNVRVVANAAFSGPAHVAVQHAVAGEGPHRTVHQFEGEFEDHRAGWPFEEIDQSAFEMGHQGRGSIELLCRNVIRVQVFAAVFRRRRFCFHESHSFDKQRRVAD